MPALPYESLGEVLSSKTLSFHHGKHLKAYIDNLNKLLPDSGLDGMSLSQLVRKVEDCLLQPEAVANIDRNKLNTLKNNAGQVLNHIMYFEQFSTSPKPMSNSLQQLLERDFGSVDAFKKEFELNGSTLFGSGWVWLSYDTNGHLVITQQRNAENPVTMRLNPLLTFDVWEHAYYLDYQNRRGDYLNALWQVIDWQVVESRL